MLLCGLGLAVGLNPHPGATALDGPRAGDLVPLVFSSAQDAAEAWTSPAGAPPVEPKADGITFPLPFEDRGVDRFYWDHKAAIDLSGADLLTLDLTCSTPEAIRSLNIYLESGDGWYVHPVSLRYSGRQRIFISLNALQSEDRPAGLGRISRLRISPWRGNGGNASVTLHALRATRPMVAILRGTASHTSAGERSFAESAAKRIETWITAAGLPSVTLDESSFRADHPARVAILAYSGRLPDAVYAEIETFARGGGKLIVCYGSDSRLADLMGFRLGDYTRLPEPERWTAFRFFDREVERLHLPPRVGQQSGNILPALPLRDDARIAAVWEDGEGQPTDVPAWTASDSGFWMSHVPNGDDTEGKQLMVSAMVAALHPAAWPWIAEPLLDGAGRIDSFDNVTAAVRSIRAEAPLARDPSRVTSLVDRAEDRLARAGTAAARGEYGFLLEAGRGIRAELTEAYALIQTPEKGEIVGIWDHSGAGWYPGDWPRTCRILKERGVTDLFVNMLWPALAHYPSEFLPESFTSRTHGDQIKACLDAARATGLRVHIWKVCWNLSDAPEGVIRAHEADGALQRDASGSSLPWLNPAVPAAARRELDTLLEVAKRYDVDGIHLDYIRYPNSSACFSPATRTAFEKATGNRTGKWPADVTKGGPREEEFQTWRASVITDFVRACRRELDAVRPGIRLSAAVFANYPDCRSSIGQDWGAWLREDLVDFVCPMNYDETLSRFEARAAAHMALPNAQGRVLQGIGATSGESRLLSDQVIEQVLATRRVGAAGFVLFDMSPTVRDLILPMLSLGLTRPAE